MDLRDAPDFTKIGKNRFGGMSLNDRIGAVQSPFVGIGERHPMASRSEQQSIILSVPEGKNIPQSEIVKRHNGLHCRSFADWVLALRIQGANCCYLKYRGMGEAGDASIRLHQGSQMTH